MIIKKLVVSNFRSIDQAEINFSPLTLIVGANASGKSNLINVFRFIKDIIIEGVDNAVALQGGTAYLSNVRAPKGKPISIRFDLDLSDENSFRHYSMRVKKYALSVKAIDYHFTLQPHKKGHGYRIAEDYLSITYNTYAIDFTAQDSTRYQPLDNNYFVEFHRKKSNGSCQMRTNVDSITLPDLQSILKHDYTPPLFLQLANEDKNELMLNRIAILYPPVFSDGSFIRLFDFDPKELKKPSSMASTKTLTENGSNIASVLHELLRKKENKEQLTTLLKQYLPYFNGLSVESNIDQSFSYKIEEQFSKRNFYASFLSDGTVSILALIIALYFEEKSKIIILEEPERNIHPKLLGFLLESAEDVSKGKQVIITTHNPEFLKHAKLEYVRLVSRNEEGNSVISEPANSVSVKAFLENNLGIDDLFLQNMLEG